MLASHPREAEQTGTEGEGHKGDHQALSHTESQSKDPIVLNRPLVNSKRGNESPPMV